MLTNYSNIARENRAKALDGLKHRRNQILALSDYTVHPKTTRSVPVAIFMSTRQPAPFVQANLH